jgi:HAMP domain-containing protein
MPAKRTPTEAEIEALTAEFRALWHAGEVVGPWLRKHQNRFRELLDEGWAWASIGEALTKAGVTYKTGRAWSGEVLRLDVKRASRPLKRTRRAVAASPMPGEAPAPSPSAAPAPLKLTPPHQRAGQAPAQAKPTFKPASPLPAPPEAAGGSAQTEAPPGPVVPRFKAFSLKPQEPPRPLTPEQQQEREAIRKRFS